MTNTTNRTVALILILILFSQVSGELPRWEFESDSVLSQWVPNSHLSNVVIKGGILRADATDWDPFFLCRNITIQAKPHQYVVIRLRADWPGIGGLFWSGELEGQYGGWTELFGNFSYTTTAGKLAPMFVNNDSAIFVFFREVCYNNDPFRTLIP